MLKQFLDEQLLELLSVSIYLFCTISVVGVHGPHGLTISSSQNNPGVSAESSVAAKLNIIRVNGDHV